MIYFIWLSLITVEAFKIAWHPSKATQRWDGLIIGSIDVKGHHTSPNVLITYTVKVHDAKTVFKVYTHAMQANGRMDAAWFKLSL